MTIRISALRRRRSSSLKSIPARAARCISLGAAIEAEAAEAKHWRATEIELAACVGGSSAQLPSWLDDSVDDNDDDCGRQVEDWPLASKSHCKVAPLSAAAADK